MNPFEMVVAIVIIVTIGKVISTRYKAKHGIIEDNAGNQKLVPAQVTQDNDAQSQEIKNLKERVQILERIVTDNSKAIDLDREIESLRNT